MPLDIKTNLHRISPNISVDSECDPNIGPDGRGKAAAHSAAADPDAGPGPDGRVKAAPAPANSAAADPGDGAGASDDRPGKAAHSS